MPSSHPLAPDAPYYKVLRRHPEWGRQYWSEINRKWETDYLDADKADDQMEPDSHWLTYEETRTDP